MLKSPSCVYLQRITFIVILLNLVIEYFLMYFETRSFIISFQSIINLSFLFYALNRTKNISPSPFTTIIVLISLYTLVLCLFSSSMIDSLNKALKFLVPLFFLIIGYKIVRDEHTIIVFVKQFRIVLFIFIFSMIYYNVFQIGESYYKEGFKIGYMTLNAFYTIIFIWIAILFFQPNKPLLDIILLLISAFIVVIILKRTMIILLLAATFIYFIRHLNTKSIASLVVVAGVGFFVFNQYLSDVFEKSVESRSSRFEEEYSFENEGRIKEIILPFIHMEDNPVMYVFGTGEVFNDRIYHIKYLRKERELHNSYIRLFWSGGILLVLFFLALFWKQASMIIKHIKFYRGHPRKINLLYFTFSILLLRFVNEVSSGITYLSFNMFCYFLIGGVIGYLAHIQRPQDSSKLNQATI